ncbi:prolyl-tRNA synthetase [Stipitochalara longipes BDJ]|nr:prolyl-tRNA synthetase [Stipitochalara longipes BDJ]
MKCLTPNPYPKAIEAVRQHSQSLLQSRIGHNICHNRTFVRNTASHTTGEAIVDGRARLSKLWVPTGGIAVSSPEDSHLKLVRAGFLRQAHSGIFHMLPLGRRVQDKLEALIDKHMHQLSASKLALSSISSEEIWSKSGRLEKAGSELFRFKDRKDVRYLLSPTHEEEITSLVASTVKSYRELPIRLYQISRKYRDERRPRQGLLRSREFIMKDLYTFDLSPSLALATYDQVRETYARLFDELKLPYLVAEADSGDMGGNLSHEFHFPTSKGEDHVISCSNCDYIANEELAEAAVPDPGSRADDSRVGLTNGISNQPEVKIHVWRGISRDRHTLVNVWYSSATSEPATTVIPEVNIHAVKAVFPELDASIEDALIMWEIFNSASHGGPAIVPTVLNLIDYRLPEHARSTISTKDSDLTIRRASIAIAPQFTDMVIISKDPSTQRPLNLLRIVDGDSCPRCSGGTLKVQKAIELGHTFHLGTRYSEPLSATVNSPAVDSHARRIDGTDSGPVPMQMGCHGIGVSRLIGAVADTLADDKGLNWPRVMAPFEVVIISGNGLDGAALEVYDALYSVPSETDNCQLDLILDDRAESFPWKMQDADLVGYPVIVIVGRSWKAERKCEVQCRRLKLREEVVIGELAGFVRAILAQL